MLATPLPSVYLKGQDVLEQTAINGVPSSRVSSETKFQSHQHLSSVLFLSLLGCMCGRRGITVFLKLAFSSCLLPSSASRTAGTTDTLSPHMLILITSQLVSKEGIIGYFSVCLSRKPH